MGEYVNDTRRAQGGSLRSSLYNKRCRSAQGRSRGRRLCVVTPDQRMALLRKIKVQPKSMLQSPKS